MVENSLRWILSPMHASRSIQHGQETVDLHLSNNASRRHSYLERGLRLNNKLIRPKKHNSHIMARLFMTNAVVLPINHMIYHNLWEMKEV